MKYYVGLDVSLKEVSICVIDADGTVAAEGKVATEPALILSWIEERIDTVERRAEHFARESDRARVAHRRRHRRSGPPPGRSRGRR